MTALRLTVPAVLLMLLAAGCMTPAPVDGARDPAGPGAADEDPVNLFLLDAPRPPSAAVSGGAEPMIHATRDGSVLLIGDTSGVWRSLDGVTWSQRPISRPGGVATDGVALAEDASGRLYAGFTQGNVLSVATSLDKGVTWTSALPVAAAAIADRPWLAGGAAGEAALVWYGFPDTVEKCARTTDGGTTWPDRNLAKTSGGVNAGNVVLTADGRVTFANDRTIVQYTAGCGGNVQSLGLPPHGRQIFTQVGVDALGRLYAAQPSPGNTGMELIVAENINAHGKVKRIVVSPPELRANTFGAISVTPEGKVAVAWYGSEAEGDPSAASFNGAWNVFVARVDDAFATSPTIRHDRLTTEANHVGGFCMGGVGCGVSVGAPGSAPAGSSDRDLLDYFGVDHGPDGTVHVAYGHDGAGRASQVRYARLAP